MKIKEALEELKKDKKRKFDQSVDLVLNLKDVDLKKENIVLVANIPHKFKDKKVCGFFTSKNPLVNSVTEADFQKYKDPEELKKLDNKYDFFIAEAKLMPKVATTFGRVLGPAGKMPSPQLGILPTVTDDSIKAVLEKISKSVKIRPAEASIKLSVGKESMSNEHVIENINSIYKEIVNVLPNKKENVKNVSVKLTMSKPIKVEIE